MTKKGRLGRAGIALVGVFVIAPARAAWTLNMTRGATAMQHQVYDLHMAMFSICVVIGLAVFATMFYSIVRHRKSRGAVAAQFHESTWVEIAWTVVPFLILAAVAIPAAATLLRVENSSDSNVTIRVTGHQWLWEYNYVNAGVHFYSRLDALSNRARQPGSKIDPASVPHYLRNVDHPMVVPVHEKVRLLITSGDVIHSWWVPALGGKKDAIPGYINDKWFKADKIGTYRGQCAELCGRGHAFMPIVVKVVSRADYRKWLRAHRGPSKDGKKPAADRSARAKSGQGPGKTLAHSQSRGPQSHSRKPVKAALRPRQNAVRTAVARGGSDPGGGSRSSGATERLTQAELMTQGRKVYVNTCAACHQADGRGLPAASFPSLKNAPVVTGPVAAHIKQVLDGKGVMPSFRAVLTDRQIAAVVSYQRNAFGNHTGDLVQSAQVARQR